LKVERQFWNLTLADRTPFTQSPGPEADALWNSISAPPGDVGIIWLTEEERRRWGVATAKAGEGSKYIVTIDVFHQLHCLDRLRRQIFNETYRIQPDANPLWKEHIAHCLDSIRLSLQCNADVSLLPWKWIKGYAAPWPDFRSEHTCRNWDAVSSWATRRKLDTGNLSLWTHPELGRIDLLDGTSFGNPMADGKRVEYLDESLYDL
jgi:hypothetical protein